MTIVYGLYFYWTESTTTSSSAISEDQNELFAEIALLKAAGMLIFLFLNKALSERISHNLNNKNDLMKIQLANKTYKIGEQVTDFNDPISKNSNNINNWIIPD